MKITRFNFQIRTLILAMLLIMAMIFIVGRLFYLQVIRHDHYNALASAEQTRQWVLPAVRGEIYAMDQGTPTKLVLNETVYYVIADPTLVDDAAAVSEALQKIAGGNLRSNYRQLLDLKDTRYQRLASNVTYRQAELIREERLAGIRFERAERRVYPEGPLASQVVGFVNADNQGQYGVEGALNDRLTGTDGLLKTVADVRDVPLTIGRNNITTPARDGDDIVLTIDRNVQRAADKALADGLQRAGARYGSAVVLDPSSGQVLAMANLPTYSPDKIDEVKDVAAFNNDVISRPYEAGSVIKTFTVAAGIDSGVITPRSTYVNTDTIRVDDRTIGNASRGQTGTITMQHAFNWSLNTGMVTIAQRMGDGNYITPEARQSIYSYFHDRFRLGRPTGIQLANEAGGTIISPDNVQGNAVRYSNMVFGQGMDVTMLQVAAGFSAAINGGTYYQPSIVAGTMKQDQFEAGTDRSSESGVISSAASSQTRQMLVEARRAFYAGDDKSGFSVGGKTGTSETLVDGRYIKNQTIGTYLGFGGEEGEVPRYVIMVSVSSPGKNIQGGAHAMPIFTDISNFMISHLKLRPKG